MKSLETASYGKDYCLSTEYCCRSSHTTFPARYKEWKGPSGSAEVFARVINQDTPEFNTLQLNALAEKVDFVKVGRRLLQQTGGSGIDSKRGNHQINVLFSGGENHVRSATEISNHYGCSMPGINDGTDKWIDTILALSELMRRVGIRWTVKPEPRHLQERMEMFARRVNEKNELEGMTVAGIRLYPRPGQIKPHTDKKNCTQLRDVIIFSEIVWIDGELWRISLIGYMRKSCRDTIIRRDACREVAERTLNYIATQPSHLVPKVTTEDYRGFFENMGELGLGLTLSCADLKDLEAPLKIHSAALFNRPHVDKPMSYISAVSQAILNVYGTHTSLTPSDLMLMCIPVGQLNGLFTYCGVLTQLAEEQLPEIKTPLRILDLVIDRVVEMTGSYSGGKFPRTQNSWPGGRPKVERTLTDLRTLQCLCSKSSECPPQGQTYDSYCEEMHKHYAMVLRSMYGVGDFGCQSLIVVLVQVGLLRPVGVMQHGYFAVSTSNLKEKQDSREVHNPALLGYLRSKIDREEIQVKTMTREAKQEACTTVQKKSRRKTSLQPVSVHEKGRRIMESVIPHLRLQMPWIVSSAVEQCCCEDIRSRAVSDFFFPLGSNYYCPFSESPEKRVMWKLTPWRRHKDEALEVIAKPHIPTHARSNGHDHEGRAVRRDKVEKLRVEKLRVVSCRIPFEYINCFGGLMNEVRQQFFSGRSNQEVCNWLCTHPIIGVLARNFSRNPLSMKQSMSYLRYKSHRQMDGSCEEEIKYSGKSIAHFSYLDPSNFIPGSIPIEVNSSSGSKKSCIAEDDCCSEEVFLAEDGMTEDENVLGVSDAAATSIKYPQTAEEDRDAKDIESNQEDCNRFKRVRFDQVKGQSPIGSCPMEMNKGSEIIFGSGTMSPKSQTVAGMVKPQEQQSASISIVKRPRSVEDDGHGHPLINTASSIRLYQFPNMMQADVIRVEIPSAVSTISRLLSHKKMRYRISPVYSELKRSFYTGMNERDMPQDMHKHALVKVLCDKNSHTLPENSSIYYMVEWKRNEALSLFTSGVCCVVDEIAQNLKGLKAERKNEPWVSNWLFSSYEQSKLHFYQCLFVLGGQPKYFKNQFQRIVTKLQEFEPKGQLPVAEVVDDTDIGTLYYVAIKKEETSFKSFVLLHPGHVDLGDKQRLRAPTVAMDVIDWKDPTYLLANPTKEVTTRSAKRSAKRRKRRMAELEAMIGDSGTVRTKETPGGTLEPTINRAWI